MHKRFILCLGLGRGKNIHEKIKPMKYVDFFGFRRMS